MTRRNKNRATMKDVAAYAGVTIGTVSHVINQTASISEETSRRVKEAIDALHYVPNAQARNMRAKTNHVIGLMIPNLTNNFHAKIASEFVNLADQNRYAVHILGYEYSLEREKNEIHSLLEYSVGTVIIVNGWGDEEYIRELHKRGVHVILADRHSDLEGVVCVEYENHQVIKDAIAHLKQKGYRSIGFISEPLNLTNLQDRYKAYKEGLKEHGYVWNPEFVYTSQSLCLDNVRNGYLYMKELLSQKKKEEFPEAFLASSDLLVIGMLRAMKEAGYQVPGDFGIIGCDNLQISGYMYPRLTTIMQDQELLSNELWKVIHSWNHEKKPQNIVLPQNLVIRESC